MKVGDKGVVIADGSDVFHSITAEDTVTKLPNGEYRVIVIDAFDDYETGPRMIGILADSFEKVYFSGYAFESDPNAYTMPHEMEAAARARAAHKAKVAKMMAEA